MKGDHTQGGSAPTTGVMSTTGAMRAGGGGPPQARRVLALTGTAHALHDGYTDLIYVLLPVWQAEFALGYGMLAVLRGLYAGAMAALQLPAGILAERFGARGVLVAGTSSGDRLCDCGAFGEGSSGSAPVLSFRGPGRARSIRSPRRRWRGRMAAMRAVR